MKGKMPSKPTPENTPKKKPSFKPPIAKHIAKVKAEKTESKKPQNHNRGEDFINKLEKQSEQNAKSTATAEPIVIVKNLVKKYGKVIANNDISFTIHRGERIGIIGANGSGKSTLVEQIIGTTRPTSGSIEYKFAFRKSPQEKMGMQFQTSSYPEGLTVKDVIDFSLEIYGANIKPDEISNLLHVFQIQDFYKSRAKGLSGGQQQKLNVLLAIAHYPELVILDEISTGLDVLAREEIIGYVDRITRAKKMSVILISHHMTEIEQLCDKVIVISRGKILHQETIAEVKKKYGNLNTLMKQVIAKEIQDQNDERAERNILQERKEERKEA